MDARAARQWLAGRTGVVETDIIVLGRSLGGAVAVDLAAGDGAAGLILESTFTSLTDVARSKPVFCSATSLMAAHLDSLSKIGNYHGRFYKRMVIAMKWSRWNLVGNSSPPPMSPNNSCWSTAEDTTASPRLSTIRPSIAFW